MSRTACLRVLLCDCARGERVRPLQPLEADGAEEEDGVEQNETESQPAVQPPAVQMDTQDLRRGWTEREREFNFLLRCSKYNPHRV